MAVSRAMRRLLNIRNLEEEQSRLALESALAELRRLEQAVEATSEWDRRGRRLIDSSAHSGELPDRLAGLEDRRAAGRRAAALAPRVTAGEVEVGALREEFLARRVERRQAETLIQETEARDAIEAGRRGQQSLDDWYSTRRHREKAAAEPDAPSAAAREREPDKT